MKLKSFCMAKEMAEEVAYRMGENLYQIYI
jgi:hypothetical protein